MHELLDQSSKDIPNVRLYPVGNNVLRATRTDPYGFVSVSYERGQVPEELKGSYTSFEEARKAIVKYIDNRPTPKETKKD
jgi:hypothetical protein